jgi:uracil-DNA glycosylase family 4
MDDDRAALRELAAGFRAHLEARARSGLLGVAPAPGRPARQPSVAPSVGAAPLAVSAALPVAAPAGEGAPSLLQVREELGDCQRCKLAGGRKQIVYGVGNPAAELVFVGEAPGADEDAQGEPFVGAAGQLLTKMIEAMGFRRQDVYICNVIKCRPPGNRNPEPDEVAACEPFLRKQLAALRPRAIVTLGKFAAQCLLRVDTPITRLRGTLRSYQGVPLMPTYHPAYLLRDPSRKREAWDDLQAVMALLKG